METYEVIANTLETSIRDATVEISPSNDGALVSDGVFLRHDNICRAKERVDVQHRGLKKYLVEHVVSVCTLLGIHSAKITGLEKEWDLSRGSHLSANQDGYKPSDVLGGSDGRIWMGGTASLDCILLKLVEKCKIAYKVPNTYKHVTDENGTSIVLKPPQNVESIVIRCSAGGFESEAAFSPKKGIIDKTVMAKIVNSRSIAAQRLNSSPGEWDEEAVWHALGDVIGDIVGLGLILADIDAKLQFYYHTATSLAVSEMRTHHK